ncbi:MAG: anthranilate synthase component I [Acidobacteriota bacterium]
MTRPVTRPVTRRAVLHQREFVADSLTPLAVYRRLAAISPHRFLLESVTGGEQVSRFSFLGAGPRRWARWWPDRLEISGAGETVVHSGDPLTALRELLAEVRTEQKSLLPFTGGWVGSFGYDVIRSLERLPGRPPDAFGLPPAVLARFDEVVVFDHVRQRIVAVTNEIEGEVSRQEAMAGLDRLAAVLSAPGAEVGIGGAVAVPAAMPAPPADARPSLPAADFHRAVRRAQEYIAAGDIFQVVLARRWAVPRAVPPVALYRALRLINPSPYMVLLELPDFALAGASPEMLVRKVGRRLETRPIAGTRPRGKNAAADRHLAEDLLADPKERAEHVMLVDLGRNDLGRVSRAGSVRVETFQQIEHYSHVMHIVSGVAGELAAGRDALDALFACFPAGTVSGAPKIRAMEIIDELEPESRGLYAGAVGYFGFGGDLDTCITIRTLVVRGEETSVTAGAGIVADSNPEREAEETENKAAALLAAVALAERLEDAR